jgi:hypothetical protein
MRSDYPSQDLLQLLASLLKELQEPTDKIIKIFPQMPEEYLHIIVQKPVVGRCSLFRRTQHHRSLLMFSFFLHSLISL